MTPKDFEKLIEEIESIENKKTQRKPL